jgi:hypothetical protein
MSIKNWVLGGIKHSKMFTIVKHKKGRKVLFFFLSFSNGKAIP